MAMEKHVVSFDPANFVFLAIFFKSTVVLKYPQSSYICVNGH